MEAKGSFSIVLLVIITILALALAGLTGYVIFGPTNTKVEAVSHEVSRPADKDLVVLKMFENKTIFNLKNSDEKKMPVIQANVELVYRKKVSGIKNPEEKIKTFDGAIKEIITTYFQNLTPEEAKSLQGDESVREKAKVDLTKKINTLLSTSEKEYKEIIYTVNFVDTFIQ